MVKTHHSPVSAISEKKNHPAPDMIILLVLTSPTDYNGNETMVHVELLIRSNDFMSIHAPQLSH